MTAARRMLAALAVTAGTGLVLTQPAVAQQTLEALTGEEASSALEITGFAVGAYTRDGRTQDNSFGAGKLAVSLFRELNDYVWLFGQLTTAVSAPVVPGEEAVTETEIDNLLVNLTLPVASNVSFSFGKFDVPVGFERDDEPLNLQSSTSFNYELARPAKMVGLVGRWALSPHLDVTALLSNGWESQVDPNHGKSGAVRVGLLPTANSSLGLSAMYGPEGEIDATVNRYLLNVDYALQPVSSLIIAGEANYGGDRGALASGADAIWRGATLTVFGQLERHFGITLRAEAFDDRDGVRTGQTQVLTSYTLAPVYFLGVGREGIFANVEHTTFRIPRFQLRGELRFNHSNQPFFETEAGLETWGVQYGIQFVATF